MSDYRPWRQLPDRPYRGNENPQISLLICFSRGPVEIEIILYTCVKIAVLKVTVVFGKK